MSFAGAMEAITEASFSQGIPAANAGVSPFDDLAAVHAAYEAKVFRFLLYSLRERDGALSLTQDTFLTAWRTRATFRGECSVNTWLMRIALNLLRDHVRTRRYKFWKQTVELEATELVGAVIDSAITADRAVAAKQELQVVWRRVEQLSSHQRTVFLLRFVDELELSEIALITGQPVPTVKSHLYRALDHIRKLRKPPVAGDQKERK